MSGNLLQAENLARCILACEVDDNDPPQAQVTSHAIEKLRLHMTKLVGVMGFHSLLGRALAMAKKQVSWLVSVQVNADGTLAGLDEAMQMQNAGEARKGELALLSQLLGLLITFIGEIMTLDMVQGVWSDLSLDDVNSGAKETKG